MENNPLFTKPENLLAMIAVIIALATYVSTVRHRLIEKERQDYLLALLVADVPLVASGFLLGIYLINGCQNCLYFGLRLFVFALVVLAFLHAYEWVVTIRRNFLP